MCERSILRAGKEITFVPWNSDMDDIIRIIKSLKNSYVLVDLVKQ